MEKEEKTIYLNSEIAGIDEAIEKVKKYKSLLEEAKTLADELASMEFKVKVESID